MACTGRKCSDRFSIAADVNAHMQRRYCSRRLPWASRHRSCWSWSSSAMPCRFSAWSRWASAEDWRPGAERFFSFPDDCLVILTPPVNRVLLEVRRRRGTRDSERGENGMFSHIMIGSNDIARSKKFYDALFVAMALSPASRSQAAGYSTRTMAGVSW